jgi:hypothetical protein
VDEVLEAALEPAEALASRPDGGRRRRAARRPAREPVAARQGG